MKTLIDYINESLKSCSPQNWPTTRFSWISDMIKEYRKTITDNYLSATLRFTQDYCKSISKGWSITGNIQPRKLIDAEVKTIYDLCELESKKENLTKPKQAKLRKTMEDIKNYFSWKEKDFDEINSLIDCSENDLHNINSALSKRFH